ncbi:putative secreted protein (Por secretion system target) [Flavobacteriaceae bacterium MAR_2010_72]|nr:putative secreted protein (Por secretion system target) [Flavobacteriaceae bacterium MAR_2010_72]
MKSAPFFNLHLFRISIFCLFFSIVANSQSDIQVEIVGGTIVYEYDIINITAGNAISFRITNTVPNSNCGNLKIEDIYLDPATGFTLEHEALPKNIKPAACKNGSKFVDFVITNISGNCNAYTEVTILMNGNDGDFQFIFTLSGAPEINVLGGSPFADIQHGSTDTTPTNGTYYGVIDEGASVSRNFIITSTGSCPLDVSSITSSLSDFAVAPYVVLPNNSIAALPRSIDPGSYIIFIVSFVAPTPATPGTYTSTISVSNTDNTTFTFNVSAEIFDFNIPGPGGITADFRLWLKSTRGVTKNGSSKVSLWKDIGTNGKNAEQPVTANQPTFIDDAASNINFNPVIKFENNGSSIEEYLYNTDNGFYSQDMFIVMVPDGTMTNASSQNTIFAGVSSEGAGDITGVGFGDYSSRFTNETLSYNQNTTASFNGAAETNTSYAKAGIINVRNNAVSSPTGQEILYNSNVLTTSGINDVSFVNVGYTDSVSPFTVFGTEYWIGRNMDVQGSLNGRVAEIFTFAERVPAAGRQKIESYLAIKYGITLGASTEAQKDYVNSFGTKVWDIAANSGYNYHVAGIGRDSISDLNQKQSKTLNVTNEVTIGLDGIFTTNNTNINEFNKDGDFLVWGSNNGAFSGTSTNSVTIASGITTSLTRIDRKWKVVESIENAGGDVENVYVSIPTAAFSSFSKTATEEYVLIVADNANFANGDIIDVIPLKSDGGSNLQTWYDFDGTKFFTFGKASKLTSNHSISIASGDYLVGEYSLNLNVVAFTISAWVKSPSNASTRTIMAKGNKLQLRLNPSDQIEVMVDDDVTPRFTSSMVINDNKWHQISFVYNNGTIFLYVDGVLDKSEQNVVAPSPNYNRFSIGALYVDKNNIINPFFGDIDEVYVWDQALSASQVRYLMNQEVEKVSDKVSGKVVPTSASSNEVAAIPYNKLKAYYDFNTFYGSTAESLVDDRNFIRLKYLDKSKSLVGAQTIAMPYISAANGEWDNAGTWANSTFNMLPNALSLDGVTYIDWNIVETSHNITSGDRDITVLGLKNNSGKITIADPNEAQDETNSGQGLTISHYLELDGVIDLVGESQLVQSEGSIIDADSGGYIERDQQGTANSFNYNYWSSSVAPIGGNTATRGTGVAAGNTNHSIAGVLFDGTVSSAYQPITFNSSATAADSSTPSNPRTISSNWLFKFYGTADDYNAWVKINQLSSLLPGEGFTMKGTSGAADILSSSQNYVFKGRPNNGTISLALDKSSGEVERLIGNPYPSAIDATAFILDNMSIADGGTNTNGTVFNGALYFWDHFGEENSHLLGDYVGGYATRNLTGGVAAISNDSRINTTSAAGSPAVGTKVPGEFIPVNQGFFVSTVIDGFNNDNGLPITTVDGGTIIFKNSQRAFVTEAISTESNFLRTTSKNNSKTKKANPIIRLTYDSPMGYHRQIAIGLHEKATNGFDLGFDAFIADINEEDMYWTFDKNKFVIQGVNNFDSSEEYLLELIVKKAGSAKIRLDNFENLNSKLPIYIKDNVTGEITQINDKPFKVYLEPGVYSDRFSLVFKPSQNRLLATNEVDFDQNFLVSYDSEAFQLHLQLQNDTLIEGVKIYDFTGKEVRSLKFGSTNKIEPIGIDKGIYILKINTEQGVVSKKVILK